MKINIDYFENEIKLEEGLINTIEVENKKYFYRLVKDLYNICNDIEIEEIKFFDENFKEINMLGKVQIFTNFFDFDFNSTKYKTAILKYINNNIEEEKRQDLISKYNKLETSYKKILNTIDLPLIIDQEFDINVISKIFKTRINNKEEIIDNLFLLIDLEKELNINELLIFINLKQYLNKEELNELYKYGLYNDIKMILLDSQCYGTSSLYEKKLIVDTNLDELVL